MQLKKKATVAAAQGIKQGAEQGVRRGTELFLANAKNVAVI